MTNLLRLLGSLSTDSLIAENQSYDTHRYRNDLERTLASVVGLREHLLAILSDQDQEDSRDSTSGLNAKLDDLTKSSHDFNVNLKGLKDSVLGADATGRKVKKAIGEIELIKSLVLLNLFNLRFTTTLERLRKQPFSGGDHRIEEGNTNLNPKAHKGHLNKLSMIEKMIFKTREHDYKNIEGLRQWKGPVLGRKDVKQARDKAERAFRGNLSMLIEMKRMRLGNEHLNRTLED